jgi:hypothetical protein
MSTVGNLTGNVFDSSVTADSSGSVIIKGDLTVEGATTTVESTSVLVEDKIIELAHGTSGTPSGDAGIIVERGSSTNSALIWDESEDAWVVCTTSATGSSTGDLTITPSLLAAGSMTVTDVVTDTDAGTFTAVDINFDKTGASTTNNTMIGINLDMDNTTATSGTNTMTAIKATPTCTHPSGSGTVNVKGMEVVATGSHTPEISTVRALDLTATGGDYCQGVLINTDDANGWDMKIVSSADSADYCTISTTTHGATAITTVDDGAAIAHLTLAPDGDVIIGGTDPKLIIGDAGTEDTMLVFDGNAADFRIGIDDGTDTLEIGLGAAHGTTPIIKIDSSTNCQVMHNSAVADGEYSGDLAMFTAGEDLTVGEVVYFKSDGKVWKAVATAAATSRCVAMCVASVSADAVGPFLLKGFARFNSAFPTWTVGGVIYTPEAEVGTNVPEQGAPDTDGDFVQVIGYAVSADAVYFDPDSTVIEVA